MRPTVERLEGRETPSTLGPRGRNLLAAQVRLAEQTVHREAVLVLHGSAAQQGVALNVLEATAEQLAAVLNPPTQ